MTRPPVSRDPDLNLVGWAMIVLIFAVIFNLGVLSTLVVQHLMGWH
jgi:hypothetical protein